MRFHSALAVILQPVIVPIQTQNLAHFTVRVGSTPTFATNIPLDLADSDGMFGALSRKAAVTTNVTNRSKTWQALTLSVRVTHTVFSSDQCAGGNSYPG